LITDDSVYEVYTSVEAFNDVTAALEKKKYKFLSAQIEMVPQNYVTLTNPDDIKNMEKMIEMMEDNEDVQNVWHNWDQE
jgi:transcriptional/translational regulatory protein YebC/TACO1